MNKFVLIEENYIPSDVCQYYINFINSNPTSSGTVSNNELDQSFKVSDDICLSLEYAEETEKILPYFRSAVRKYREQSGIRLNTDSLSEISLRKYREGQGFYKEHIDINCNNHIFRAFVILFYLNDVQEGGELVLPNHDISIKPKEGMMVIFPSGWTWEHEAKRVTKGDRYILRSFGLITP